MNEKITLTLQNGTNVQADLICIMEETQTGLKYLYYTLNEMFGAGANTTIKIYVGKLKQNNPSLDTPISDSEWEKLKGYMGNAIQSKPNADIKYLPASSISEFVSVGENAIAMPVSYDYVNKQRGEYAQAVASMDVKPVEAEPVSTPAETESAPVAPTPAPEQPVSPAPTPEAAPVTDNLQLEPVKEEPVSPVNNEVPVSAPDTAAGTPIDIAEIEKKYEEMIKDINALKNKEIEAAKRYNATLELSAMHNEQHANYVASEQSQAANEPVTQAPINPEPAHVNSQMPVPEPQAVETTNVAPAATTQTSNTDIETNWFDMPAA